MHNQPDVSAYANRPEIVVLCLVELVELQTRMSRIHLKVKCGSLDSLLLLAIQLGEAVGALRYQAPNDVPGTCMASSGSGVQKIGYP